MFKHKEHKYYRIQEAMKVENADITNSLPSLKKAHSTVSQSKEKMESVMLSITNHREAIKSHINDIFQSVGENSSLASLHVLITFSMSLTSSFKLSN